MGLCLLVTAHLSLDARVSIPLISNGNISSNVKKLPAFFGVFVGCLVKCKFTLPIHFIQKKIIFPHFLNQSYQESPFNHFHVR